MPAVSVTGCRIFAGRNLLAEKAFYLRPAVVSRDRSQPGLASLRAAVRTREIFATPGVTRGHEYVTAVAETAGTNTLVVRRSGTIMGDESED